MVSSFFGSGICEKADHEVPKPMLPYRLWAFVFPLGHSSPKKAKVSLDLLTGFEAGRVPPLSIDNRELPPRSIQVVVSVP